MISSPYIAGVLTGFAVGIAAAIVLVRSAVAVATAAEKTTKEEYTTPRDLYSGRIDFLADIPECDQDLN